MNRIAIKLARWALRWLSRGDHTIGYMDRIRDAKAEIDEIDWIYFGGSEPS